MKHLITLFLAICTTVTHGQQEDMAQLNIVSSTVCDMCERTIEENLIYEKGVQKVDVDLATSTVHITYKAEKNTPEGLRAALVKLGYSADGVPGDPKACAMLPACCQKEGCGKLPTEPKP